MSAFGGKADMTQCSAKCLLLTQSGHKRPSDFVEAAARRNKTSSDVEGFDCTMVLDGGDTRPIGLDASGNFDLACGTTRFDAQTNGGQRHHDPLDQRLTSAAERLDAATDDKPTYRLADLDADRSIRVGNDPVKVGDVYRAGVHIEAACTLTEGFNRCGHCSSCIVPKFTKPIPLGPCEVIFSSAIQRSTTPQLSSTMSLTP